MLHRLGRSYLNKGSTSRCRRLGGTAEKEFVVTGSLLTEKGLSVGQYAEVVHTFSQQHVNTFAGLCGDSNPLHSDPDFAESTMFGGTIVHGIFVSSLFSTLFGRSIVGSIYVSQTLNFKRPVHVGVPVTARMEILKVEEHKKGKVMTCSTSVLLADGKAAVSGEAKVLVPTKE
jgi:3-hydroxybutyryl-CoA dehydratase